MYNNDVIPQKKKSLCARVQNCLCICQKAQICHKLFNLICFIGYFKTTLSSSIWKVLNNFEKKQLAVQPQNICWNISSRDVYILFYNYHPLKLVINFDKPTK